MQETLEGYVIDVACLRKYPRDEIPSRAHEHTRTCALMGHCIESGYGLVDVEGRVSLLDTAATPHVIEAVTAAAQDRGIRLCVQRQRNEDGEMKTEAVSLVR